MSQQWVVVYTAAGPGLADIIRGTLEAAGIPVNTSREGAGAAYGFTVGPLGMVDILVPEEDVDDAEELLAAMQRGDLDDESDAIIVDDDL